MDGALERGCWVLLVLAHADKVLVEELDLELAGDEAFRWYWLAVII